MPVRNAHLVELMRAAQAGNMQAYERLLEAVTPIVRHRVQRQRGFLGRDEIEDLVQDVLLSLHVVRGTYHPERPFIPWLFAIVRNRLADGARRHARISAHEIRMPDLDVTFYSNDTNLLDEGYGNADALRQAIEALPAGQRQAIELLKLREMSLTEAAAASGTTVGALKVATHRAITALRRVMMTK